MSRPEPQLPNPKRTSRKVECVCDWPSTCEGTGMLQCEGCGGQDCVCDCGGEIECPGCDDCPRDDDMGDVDEPGETEGW